MKKTFLFFLVVVVLVCLVGFVSCLTKKRENETDAPIKKTESINMQKVASRTDMLVPGRILKNTESYIIKEIVPGEVISVQAKKVFYNFSHTHAMNCLEMGLREFYIIHNRCSLINSVPIIGYDNHRNSVTVGLILFFNCSAF